MLPSSFVHSSLSNHNGICSQAKGCLEGAPCSVACRVLCRPHFDAAPPPAMLLLIFCWHAMLFIPT